MIKSEVSHARLDESTRVNKANKILSVLGDYVNIGECNVIDIGTGSGHIATEMGKVCKSLTSVDLYDERVEKDNYEFVKVDDERLPFKDGMFDVAISNHVIEHVPNQNLHVKEIRRMLKPGGVFYLATPNRFWYMDPHYKLPFITWLPRFANNIIFKVFKKKEWDIYSMSYFKINKLVRKWFKIDNISLKMIRNPKKFNLDVYKRLHPFLKYIPTSFLSVLNYFLPTYVLVLRKK